MVQSKHQKSKPKKQSQGKKHGKQGDISDFRAQLDLLGLKIIQVISDGNCFFRALADQLEGNEEEHEKYRRIVVQYIRNNREMFEPFIEDEVPFDEYCQSMEKDGTWAGNMELQAASLVTRNNICIHRSMSPRWYIRNFDSQGARMIHLSYHDGEHYNSVRSKDDLCSGPAKPIIIKADVNLTASSQLAKSADVHSSARTSKNVVHGVTIKMVMAGSACNNAEKVEQVLLQVDGDVDAAIEFLIAEQAGEAVEESNACDENDNHVLVNGGSPKSDEHKENRACPDSTEGKVQWINNETGDGDRISVKSDQLQKIPRNKVCPCGSKKKHKSCCGAPSGKPFSKVIVNSEAHTRSRRGKQEKKAIPRTKSASCVSDNKLPDMGALCI